MRRFSLSDGIEWLFCSTPGGWILCIMAALLCAVIVAGNIRAAIDVWDAVLCHL